MNFIIPLPNNVPNALSFNVKFYQQNDGRTLSIRLPLGRLHRRLSWPSELDSCRKRGENEMCISLMCTLNLKVFIFFVFNLQLSLYFTYTSNTISLCESSPTSYWEGVCTHSDQLSSTHPTTRQNEYHFERPHNELTKIIFPSYFIVTSPTTVSLLSLLCTSHMSVRKHVPFTLGKYFREELRSMDSRERTSSLSSPCRNNLEKMGTMQLSPFPTSRSATLALHRQFRGVLHFFLITSSHRKKVAKHETVSLLLPYFCISLGDFCTVSVWGREMTDWPRS